MDYHLERSGIGPALQNLEQRQLIFRHLPIDPLHAEWFRRRAWIRTIHGTTRIEGNSLNDLEVEELLTDPTNRFPRKEALEVLGSREALTFVDELAPRDVPIDESVVREIHRRVLDDINPLLTPGAYRQGPNAVGDADGNIIFTTPPSGDVPALMREFGHWLRGGMDDQPAPVGAALAHLEFVAIHPFYDGNGRTSRALARLILLRGAVGFDGLVSLDAYLDNDRTTYFAAISASTRGRYEPGYDATPFVTYFLDAITGAADRVLTGLRGLGEVMIEIRRDITTGAMPPSLLDGLAYAWVNRSLRAADYIRITGRSPQSTTRDLAAAVAAGFLVPTGEGRWRRYVLGPRLSIMGASAGETR
jgi:Fic family protein